MIDFCSYNIRGLHNKVSFAKDFISVRNLSLVALLETHVKEEDAAHISNNIAPRFNWIFNYDSHVNGRIWLGWDVSIWKVHFVCSTAQHITCEVMRVDGTCSCLLTMVYAYNSAADRRILWTDLEILRNRFTVNDSMRPWCVMGDFNVFLNDFESNRPMPRRRTHIDEFRNCISNIGVTDLRYQGHVFTWWDSGTVDPVMRKLDRIFVNESWLHQFDLSIAEFLPHGLSDHNPAVVRMGVAINRIKKPFQLFAHLLENDNFIPCVQHAWATQVSGDPWFQLTTKLQRVKSALKALNRNMGNLHSLVESARSDLLNFQNLLPPVPDQYQRIEEGRLSLVFQQALFAEEVFLRQKSRVRWLKAGDKCNKFFFNSCKDRWNTNKVLKIIDDNGAEHTDHASIASVAVNYFKSLLGNSVETHEMPNLSGIKKLSDMDKAALCDPFTEDDIFAAFKSMAKGKSPGPDGFTPEFFIKAWSVVGSDTSKAILYFFDSNFMPRMINSSAIVLVPKCSNASNMSQFRPISCCNVLYKCIAKLLAFRMKKVIGTVISSNQTAFVPNRCLGDNVLLAQALFRDYHLNLGTPRFSCKLDIKKAFDTVSWTFILKVLTAMNFPPIFIKWIEVCITTCRHSVKLNGALEGYFAAASGLRQGDPLSPYLFVIAMEVLNVCVNQTSALCNFNHHWRCAELKITHLVFADDLLMFCKGDLVSINAILEAVRMFAGISGLHLNASKCTAFFGNVDPSVKSSTLAQSGFSDGSLPVVYLGLPLVSRSLKTRDCLPLIEKLSKRILKWTIRFISQAGRLQLLNAVLFGIHSFWASCIFLPASVIKKVNGVLSRFLWAGTLTGGCVFKIAWKNCCFPKTEGGLGIKNLKDWNMAAILFQLWRILNRPDSLWVSWIYEYELKRKGFWSMPIPRHCSWGWKCILSARPLALQFISYEPGISSNFLLWHDPWLNHRPLCSQLDSSVISALESTSLALLNSIQNNGVWDLGVSNYQPVRDLREACSRIIPRSNDRIVWDAGSLPLKIASIYQCISCHRPKPPWFDFIWNKFSIPKFSFTAWLAIQERLLTMDRMLLFNMFTDGICLLCLQDAETHCHLFCDCPFTRSVLNSCPIPVTSQWSDLCRGNCFTAHMDYTRVHVAYLFISAVFYHIWGERNLRMHNTGQYNLAPAIITRIKETVREKLFSCAAFQMRVRRDIFLNSFIY